MTDERPISEVFRSLGRIEAGVAELKDSAGKRDESLAALTERVRQNQHTANNNAQAAHNGVERLGIKIAGVAVQVDGLDGRVSNLDTRVQAMELPVRRAMLLRQHRRQAWIKVVSVASAVSVLMWAIFEPLYKVFVELLAKRWLG